MTGGSQKTGSPLYRMREIIMNLSTFQVPLLSVASSDVNDVVCHSASNLRLGNGDWCNAIDPKTADLLGRMADAKSF